MRGLRPLVWVSNQERAASEMMRVCRVGGKIELANWTPADFVGQFLKTIGKHLPPSESVKAPAM